MKGGYLLSSLVAYDLCYYYNDSVEGQQLC